MPRLSSANCSTHSGRRSSELPLKMVFFFLNTHKTLFFSPIFKRFFRRFVKTIIFRRWFRQSNQRDLHDRGRLCNQLEVRFRVFQAILRVLWTGPILRGGELQIHHILAGCQVKFLNSREKITFLNIKNVTLQIFWWIYECGIGMQKIEPEFGGLCHREIRTHSTHRGRLSPSKIFTREFDWKYSGKGQEVVFSKIQDFPDEQRFVAEEEAQTHSQFAVRDERDECRSGSSG